MGNFKQRYLELKNSPEFQRRSFEKRQTALWLWVLGVPLIGIGELLVHIFHLNEYVMCVVAGTSAYAAALMIATKKANKKFGLKS